MNPGLVPGFSFPRMRTGESLLTPGAEAENKAPEDAIIFSEANGSNLRYSRSRYSSLFLNSLKRLEIYYH